MSVPLTDPPLPDTATPRLALRAPITAVLWVIALTCLIEATLIAADHGLVGSARWRPLAYQNGAFWSGLMLGDWRPNFALQPGTMFVTYALLHGGLGHLLGNMVALVGLGGIVTDRLGQRGFLLLYLMSAIGGAFGFGLLSSATAPMVGASGALFGLAGAWKYWDWADRRARGAPPWPVVWAVLGLVALNVVMWVLLGGLLAWQTHLGGFLTGWAAAALWPRARPRA